MNEQLDRIEAKLDRILNPPPPPIVDTHTAMQLLGCESYSAFYRRIKSWNIPKLSHGKFRRLDITNRIAERALQINLTIDDHPEETVAAQGD